MQAQLLVSTDSSDRHSHMAEQSLTAAADGEAMAGQERGRGGLAIQPEAQRWPTTHTGRSGWK